MSRDFNVIPGARPEEQPAPDREGSRANASVEVRARISTLTIFVTIAAVGFTSLIVWGEFGGRGSILFLAVVSLAGLLSLVFALLALGRLRQAVAGVVLNEGEASRILEIEVAAQRALTQRAEETSAAKSEVFAVIAHELRTPLHGIIGALRVAIDRETSSDRLQQLEMACRSAQVLLNTIGDVLDFTRLEAHCLDLEPVYFSVRQLFADALKPLGITAAEKGLALVYGIAAEIPDRLWGDPVRVRQILVNLVGNAIKFTSSGEVVVRARCESMSVEGVTVCLEVSDTGTGIDRSLWPLLLDPFSARTTVRRHSGGLGLGIVTRLVQAMGGTVAIASELGEGSTFRVVLSLRSEPVGTEALPEWEEALAGMRILVIEPNGSARAILEEALRAHGLVPEVYATLERALRPSIRAAYGCLVADDIVLATTPWIPPVPVVRIVSPLSPSSGPGVFVTRPVDQGELIEAIGAALGIAEPAIAYTLERRVDALRPLRALVAGQPSVALELVADSARRLGYIVTDTAEADPELIARKGIDVVLVDVPAEGFDALNLARRLRARELDTRTPLIALTASAAADGHARCIAAGFDAVIQTPVTQKNLSAVIREVTGSMVPLRETEDADMTILDAVGGNPRLLARVRDAFAVQVPRLLAAMRDAIERKDTDALARAARTLRVAISNFDVPEPIADSLQLEHAATAADFTRAGELLPKIEAAIQELEQRIDRALE